MGKADTITKEYLKNPLIFADAFNFVFGDDYVKPESLRETSETETAALDFGENSSEPVQKIRDVMKKMIVRKEDGSVVYILLGAENQTAVHYAMPARTMLYDALRYHEQVIEQGRRNRVKKAYRGRSGDEFLSGYLPENKLIPVITVVIYYGSKPWNGPRSLLDMMEVPERYLPWIENYKINIIEPAALRDEDLKKFKTSLREVVTVAKFASDRSRLEKALQDNQHFEHLDPMAAKVIEVLSGETLKGAERKDGTFDMCKAFEDQRKLGISEGIAQGMEQGIAQGMEQGIAQGITQGIAQGEMQGSEKQAKETAIYMRNELHLKDEVIAAAVGRNVDLVKTWLYGFEA